MYKIGDSISENTVVNKEIDIYDLAKKNNKDLSTLFQEMLFRSQAGTIKMLQHDKQNFGQILISPLED